MGNKCGFSENQKGKDEKKCRESLKRNKNEGYKGIRGASAKYVKKMGMWCHKKEGEDGGKGQWERDCRGKGRHKKRKGIRN